MLRRRAGIVGLVLLMGRCWLSIVQVQQDQVIRLPRGLMVRLRKSLAPHVLLDGRTHQAKLK